MPGQGVELSLPKASVAFDPFPGGSHGLRDEAAAPNPSVFRAGEEPGILQNPKVLRDGRERHVERLGQVADRGLSPRQSRQDTTAGGIRQGGEGRVQCAIGIVNHMVKYCRAMVRLSSAKFEPFGEPPCAGQASWRVSGSAPLGCRKRDERMNWGIDCAAAGRYRYITCIRSRDSPCR